MSHLSSTPLIARAVLLAGVLLAILALLSPSHFPAYAQGISMDEIEDYPENSTHTVAAYTAMDPEGEDITWSLSEEAGHGADYGDFTIDGGVLMFNDPPDFESPTDKVQIDDSDTTGVNESDDATNNTYNVTVVASDGEQTTIATVTVTVTVTNVEEPGTVSLSELQPKVGFPITATLTDPDNPDGGIANLTWEWERSQDGSTGWTNIATTTIIGGTTTTTTTIVDGTTTTTIETTVTGTTATTTTTITTDGTDPDETSIETDIAAIADQATTAFYIPVADDVGSYLRVTASYTDGHSPDPEDPDKTAQAVSAHAVQAKDYVPAPPVFPDHDPDADGIQTTRIIAENSAPGTAVGAPVVATDIGADGSQEVLIYTLDGTDVNSFDIDRKTGQITVGAGTTLDHETKTEYTVTVTATDPGRLMSTAITVTINVTDVNEDPSITESLDEFTRAEDITDLAVATYTATDPEDDEDTSVDLTWSLSRSDKNRFAIGNTDSDRGQLTFKSPPDYEAPTDSGRDNVYNVTVVVTDSDRNTDSLPVTITINPVAEGHTLTLSNRRPEEGVRITANFDSLDGIKRGSSITWEWTTDNFSTLIAGATSNTYRPVMEDVNSTLSVKATYLDGHLDLGTSITATFDSEDPVLGKDINEPPKFLDSDNDAITATERMVNENTSGGVAIGAPVEATDNDPSGDNTDLIYTVSGSDADSFDIDSGTGQLSTKADLDYEDPRNTDHRYVVQVTATDPSGAAANIRVTINVNNLDENPKISGDDPEPYMEGDTGEVARFTAIDPEKLPILWDLAGTDAGDFSIDGGVLMFENTPDYETPADNGGDNSYEITVSATAGTGANATATRDNVTVTVMNVDEDGEVTLSELQPKVGVPLTAMLTDPDGGDGDALPITAEETRLTSDATWQWARSTNKSSWTDIDEADEDENYTPVADDVGSYLRATATYTDGAMSSEDNPSTTNVDESKDVAASVSVNTVLMADYSNKAPEFKDDEGEDTTTAERNVAENSVPGTAVGDPVTAEDMGADGMQEVLLYTLADATGNPSDSNPFTIDRATGQISVAAGAELDYEDSDNIDHEYQVEVTATDPSGNVVPPSSTGVDVSITVTIEVTDVKEAPELAEPMVTDGAVTAGHTEKDHEELSSTLPQDPEYSAIVSTYSATDHEDNVANTDLQWSLSGADMDKFEISATTGASTVLSFKSSTAPDFESPSDSGKNNVYNVTVVVTDNDGQTDSRDVAVTVTNVEEDGTVTLSNRQPEANAEIRAELTDPDGSITGLTWQWHWGESSGGATWNLISLATSDTYTPAPGSEEEENYLRATASYTDNAMNKDNPDTDDVDESKVKDDAESVSDFRVQAMADTNDTPQFTDQDPDVDGNQTEREVGEDATPGTTTVGGPVTATDTNADDELTYTLSGTDDDDLFAIDRGTGQISVGAETKLDYEAKDTYTVTVTATDSSLASDTITVTIKVVDVDENPVVSKSGLGITGENSIDHDEDDTSDVATYTAAGQAAPGATWSLGGDDAGDFSISSSGVLTFRSTPDFENPTDQGTNNMYNVMVKATSGAIEASLPVTVTVGNLEEDGSVTLSSNQDQVKVDVPITAVVTDLDVVTPNTVTWRWASSANANGPWTNIPGATDEAYTPVDDDVGNYLQATASYEDGHSSGKSEEAATASAVLAITTDIIGTNGDVTLSPAQPVVGEAVTASLTDSDSPVSDIEWQWARASSPTASGTPITGATSTSYTPVQADVGSYLRATVTYTDAQGPNQSASAATANAVNEATTTPIHRFDSNRDGSIQRDEVIGAINAFLLEKTATRDEVIEVINLYLLR